MLQATETDTKTRILDEAERLFADQGFEATSLREITAAAKVNLAAVNYHFRSKEELLRAVMVRRTGPVNRKRLAMLDDLQAKGEVTVEGVMYAFYQPVVELHEDRTCRIQPLLGRVFGEPGPVREFFLDQMAPVAMRFAEVLRELLPELPAQEVYWRLYFSAALLAFTMAAPHVLQRISEGACNPADVEGATRRMVAFACAGLRDPLYGDLCSEKQ
jgi:AcrR family transcriptional regulator